MNFTNEFEPGPAEHWDPRFQSVCYSAFCHSWFHGPWSSQGIGGWRVGAKAELRCVVLCLPFSCCLSTTLLGKHLWRRRVVVKRRRWQSSHLLLAEFAHMGIYAPLMRECACAQNYTQPCIVGTRAHMVELHYSKLNQCWRRSEMQGKTRTLTPLEAYKMPGSLHTRIHLLHKIPVRYVLFLPLYSWSVEDRLRNLSKFTEFIHNRAIIWYLGCIFSNPPSFLLYFSACQARRVIRII